MFKLLGYGAGAFVAFIGCAALYNLDKPKRPAADVEVHATITKVAAVQLEHRLTGIALSDVTYYYDYEFVANNGKTYGDRVPCSKAKADSLAEGHSTLVIYNANMPCHFAEVGGKHYFTRAEDRDKLKLSREKQRGIGFAFIAVGIVMVVGMFFCKDGDTWN